jgi:predicted nuclease of predicted toxin-antitoxin system
VKLLLDHNLSPRLIRMLAEVYPACEHVHNLGMDTASDTEIWNYAREHGFTIVSKDSDFHRRSLMLGAPPRVIWLRLGNASVGETADLLRERFIAIRHFHDESGAAVLALTSDS